MPAVRLVVACADVLTHLQVRSQVCSATPCGQPALPAEGYLRTVTATVWTLLLPMPW